MPASLPLPRPPSTPTPDLVTVHVASAPPRRETPVALGKNTSIPPGVSADTSTHTPQNARTHSRGTGQSPGSAISTRTRTLDGYTRGWALRHRRHDPDSELHRPTTLSRKRRRRRLCDGPLPLPTLAAPNLGQQTTISRRGGCPHSLPFPLTPSPIRRQTSTTPPTDRTT